MLLFGKKKKKQCALWDFFFCFYYIFGPLFRNQICNIFLPTLKRLKMSWLHRAMLQIQFHIATLLASEMNLSFFLVLWLLPLMWSSLTKWGGTVQSALLRNIENWMGWYFLTSSICWFLPTLICLLSIFREVMKKRNDIYFSEIKTGSHSGG